MNRKIRLGKIWPEISKIMPFLVWDLFWNNFISLFVSLFLCLFWDLRGFIDFQTFFLFVYWDVKRRKFTGRTPHTNTPQRMNTSVIIPWRDQAIPPYLVACSLVLEILKLNPGQNISRQLLISFYGQIVFVGEKKKEEFGSATQKEP